MDEEEPEEKTTTNRTSWGRVSPMDYPRQINVNTNTVATSPPTMEPVEEVRKALSGWTNKTVLFALARAEPEPTAPPRSRFSSMN